MIANGDQTIGIGAGQMSRVDSCRLAIEKARLPVAGTVAASDAFFPFRDGLDLLADAGVTAIVHPGGSKRDDEVIAAADERGIALAAHRRAATSGTDAAIRLPHRHAERAKHLALPAAGLRDPRCAQDDSGSS